MPRAAGQIDLQKNEAILDAAATVLSERGMAAPIERIAKVAGVSKQTIYNHYGSKQELVRALIARRVTRMTEALDPSTAAENIEAPLASFAEQVLWSSMSTTQVPVTRIIIASGQDMADLAQQIYEVGPELALRKLTHFLEAANQTGRIATPNAKDAAEYFIGMVLGQRYVRQILGMPQRQSHQEIPDIAQEAARRFLRAYAP